MHRDIITSLFLTRTPVSVSVLLTRTVRGLGAVRVSLIWTATLAVGHVAVPQQFLNRTQNHSHWTWRSLEFLRFLENTRTYTYTLCNCVLLPFSAHCEKSRVSAFPRFPFKSNPIFVSVKSKQSAATAYKF